MTVAPVQPIPGSEPSPEGGDGLAALAALCRLGRGRFTLGFACYERSAQRSRLVARLRGALPDWVLVEVSLQDPRLDPRERTGEFFRNLRRVAEANAAGNPIDGVLLVDWEQRLSRPETPGEALAVSFAGRFNRGRHILRDAFPCPVVVFVPLPAMTILEGRAPDFVAWQSGAFLFPSVE
jgi:hypothetical protein